MAPEDEQQRPEEEMGDSYQDDANDEVRVPVPQRAQHTEAFTVKMLTKEINRRRSRP